MLAPDGQEDRIGSFFNGSMGCDDVEYAYDKLRARGVEFTGPSEKKPFPHVYFKDPDGNTFFLSTADYPLPNECEPMSKVGEGQC